MDSHDRTIQVGDARLTTRQWGSGIPEIVMLHDGLGSIEQWQDVPTEVAEGTGRTILAYDRSGHGSSMPTPAGPWPADWLHRQAAVLDGLLDELGIVRPLLVGHSDGGSIALIHQAEFARSKAVLTLAAHAWVEAVCFDAIIAMRETRDRFETGLAPFHQHPAEVFEAWSGVWVSAEFQNWDIRPLIGTIEGPVWVAQGSEDEYASRNHPDEIASAIGSSAQSMLLEGGRHLLHYRDPQMVIDLITRFIESHS